MSPTIEHLDDYRPPVWLRNGHLQSILPSFEPRRSLVMRNSRRLREASRDVLVDCGDGVRLLGHYAAQPPSESTHPRELVLMVHGWEGSAESIYVLSAGQYLYDRGYEIFRLNLRDHGPTHHLNADLFHSCRIGEVLGAVRSVQEMFPTRSLTMIGYSLGGNFTLRVAARAPENGIRLRQALAVCPVLDPAHTMTSLEHGLWIYRNYFVLKWRKSLLKKHRAWPDLYDLDELKEHRELSTMTEHLILKYSEYDDLESYLNGYSIVGDVLAKLEVPSRILTALDDPIIPASDLARLASSPNLRVATTAYGGHCGYMEGFGGYTWADRRLYAMVEAGPRGTERPGDDSLATPEPAPEGPR